MSELLYPTIDDAMRMHARLIADYGGSLGLREPGALESALMRPQLGYYETLEEQAAALLESLAMNHPFVDGNKRIAYALTDFFLQLNGFEIVGDSQAIYDRFMEWFDAGQFRMETLLPWLREHVRPLEDG